MDALSRHALKALVDAIRAEAPVSDASFDQVFPEELRGMSQVHWTPVDVARRVVELLAPAAGDLVLDVGAGVGKVCLIGALRSEAIWCGLDLRARLLHAAERAAARLGVASRVQFLQTEVTRVAWDRADGVYLYNPFGELLMEPDVSSLREVGPLGGIAARAARSGHCRRLVEATAAKAWELRVGARVVTFHGFGGQWPSCLELVQRERAGTDFLELWVRVGAIRRPSRSAEGPPALAGASPQ